MADTNGKRDSSATSLVWLWQDLRLNDNPAVDLAVEAGNPIVFCYLYTPEEEGDWPPGGAAKWWLHHSLESLSNDLEKKKSKLIIRRGPSAETLGDLIDSMNVTQIFWNQRYEPAIEDRDHELREDFESNGIRVEVTNGNLLHDPDEIFTTAGDPYKVFSPFFKKVRKEVDIPEPTTAPKTFKAPESFPESLSIDDLELLPSLDWADAFSERWTPGEAGAKEKMDRFLKQAVKSYKNDRNRMDLFGTSRLSPHLHWGEISPRQIWHTAENWYGQHAGKHVRKQVDHFESEVGWRDFAYHLLWHFPATTTEALRENFRDFPWSENSDHLRLWQRGQTGYPIVDAAMRELWTTGWMHNRCRMIVASFLTKDLLIPWQDGAEWFWDCLVDADLANNTLGWQWTAGCGADAAPYFRVFNPIGQAEKFDPDGDYVRQWCPELKHLPTKWLHKPFEAPKDVLEDAGVKLGKDYPHPIVDHSEARKEALGAYEKIKG